MNEKPRGPKKGAARKWAQRLREFGEQPPPQDLLEKIKTKDRAPAATALT